MHRRLERAKAPAITTGSSEEIKAHAVDWRRDLTGWVQAGARSDPEKPEAVRNIALLSVSSKAKTTENLKKLKKGQGNSDFFFPRMIIPKPFDLSKINS